MKLCRHQKHIVIDDIWEEHRMSDSVYINVKKVDPEIDHYIIKFEKSGKYKDWFYMSGKDIRASRTQPNGRGTVYAVPLYKRDTFEPIKECEHNLR